MLCCSALLLILACWRGEAPARRWRRHPGWALWAAAMAALVHLAAVDVLLLAGVLEPLPPASWCRPLPALEAARSALQQASLRPGLLLTLALVCALAALLSLGWRPPLASAPGGRAFGAGAMLLLLAALDHELFQGYRLPGPAGADGLLLLPGLLLLWRGARRHRRPRPDANRLPLPAV